MRGRVYRNEVIYLYRVYHQKKKNNPDELMHYGVLGMKWGVRRYQNRDGSLTKTGKKHKQSSTQKDARRLANAATKHYRTMNQYNSLIDSGANINKSDVKSVVKTRKKCDRLVKKLNKKYGSVTAVPEFDKNGYVVKSVEASITKLDRKGRVDTVAKSSNPVETYDYRFGGKTQRERYTRNRQAINKKYNDKISAAKTKVERELLELEKEDELDRL